MGREFNERTWEFDARNSNKSEGGEGREKGGGGHKGPRTKTGQKRGKDKNKDKKKDDDNNDNDKENDKGQRQKTEAW